MSNFKRFDRHEVFEMSDTSFVLDCIKETDKHDYENGGAELANMLFGLFDGFYYNKIHPYAAEWLPMEMFERLEDLLVKIDEKFMQDNLAATGSLRIFTGK